MGIMSNTVSICHFRVMGELAAEGDFPSIAHELLALHAFTPIDENVEEISIGWAHQDDPRFFSFGSSVDCWKDHYLTFTMRRDQRKVPTALLAEHVAKECDKFLAEHPHIRRVSKEKKTEIKETVRLRLLAKTLPDPKTYDVVWDTETGVITFTTFSPKMIETFEDLFKKTFEGLRMVHFIPYHRAQQVIGSQGQILLDTENRATGDNYLELLKANEWIGQDFLYWLFFQTLNADSEYRINQPGPAVFGEQFVAYINDRVVLFGEGEGGRQMVTINGPQDRFTEVRSSLKGNKRICEATIHLETADYHYNLTLKGGEFHFASLSTPPVKIEKDNTVDERLEREAVFFERMALLERGLQMFDSLFCTFLKLRLSSGWGTTEIDIIEWVEAA